MHSPPHLSTHLQFIHIHASGHGLRTVENLRCGLTLLVRCSRCVTNENEGGRASRMRRAQANEERGRHLVKMRCERGGGCVCVTSSPGMGADSFCVNSVSIRWGLWLAKAKV